MRTKDPIEIPEEVREHLSYDPVSGIVRWVKPVSNRTPVGTELKRDRVSFKGVHYSLGRIIFTLMGEPVPQGHHVCHVNGDRNDYRWENLKTYEIGFPKVLKIDDGYSVVYAALFFGKYQNIENARMVCNIIVKDRQLD